MGRLSERFNHLADILFLFIFLLTCPLVMIGIPLILLTDLFGPSEIVLYCIIILAEIRVGEMMFDTYKELRLKRDAKH